MSFLAAIRGNLSRLHDFTGREQRQSFWRYVLAIMAALMVAGVIGMMLLMQGMSGKVQAIAAAHPEDVTIPQGPGSYSVQVHGNHPELMPDFAMALTVWSVAAALVVLLLAAAVARRLHDRGSSGAWGLMPLPFLFSGLFGMRRAFGSMKGGGPDLGWFFLIFANNLVYLGTLAVLVVLLAKAGDPAPNRFGAAPLAG